MSKLKKSKLTKLIIALSVVFLFIFVFSLGYAYIYGCGFSYVFTSCGFNENRMLHVVLAVGILFIVGGQVCKTSPKNH